jgi:hypothetical protein
MHQCKIFQSEPGLRKILQYNSPQEPVLNETINSHFHFLLNTSNVCLAAIVVSPTHFIAFFVEKVVKKAAVVHGTRASTKAAQASLALAVQISRLALDRTSP